MTTEYSQYEGSKKRLAAVIRKEAAAIRKEIEETATSHGELLSRLQDVTASLILFTEQEIRAECGLDDLAFRRQAHDLAEVRTDLRHHQLVMEGIDLNEEGDDAETP